MKEDITIGQSIINFLSREERRFRKRHLHPNAKWYPRPLGVHCFLPVICPHHELLLCNCKTLTSEESGLFLEAHCLEPFMVNREITLSLEEWEEVFTREEQIIKLVIDNLRNNPNWASSLETFNETPGLKEKLKFVPCEQIDSVFQTIYARNARVIKHLKETGPDSVSGYDYDPVDHLDDGFHSRRGNNSDVDFVRDVLDGNPDAYWNID